MTLSCMSLFEQCFIKFYLHALLFYLNIVPELPFVLPFLCSSLLFLVCFFLPSVALSAASFRLFLNGLFSTMKLWWRGRGERQITWTWVPRFGPGGQKLALASTLIQTKQLGLRWGDTTRAIPFWPYLRFVLFFFSRLAGIISPREDILDEL